MAETTIATTNTLVPKKVLNELLSTLTRKKSYFAKFMGKSKDSIIQVLDALKKTPGDEVTAHLGLKLTGDGVVDDATLEGNEDAMSFKHMKVKIGQRRKAVKIGGKMTEKRSAINLIKEGMRLLSNWAKDVMDEEIFFHLSCARGIRTAGQALSLSYNGGFQGGFVTPNAEALIVAGAGAKATLTANDTMSCAVIDEVALAADLSEEITAPTGVEGSEGVEIRGVMVISPEQAFDLRRDADWKAAQKDANIRGSKNPLFSGALGIYNGIVVHVSNRVVAFDDYGASSDLYAARALFLACQAGIFADVNEWDHEHETFDYKNKQGFSIGRMYGVKGSAFKAEDGSGERIFGRLLVDTAISKAVA